MLSKENEKIQEEIESREIKLKRSLQKLSEPLEKFFFFLFSFETFNLTFKKKKSSLQFTKETTLQRYQFINFV